MGTTVSIGVALEPTIGGYLIDALNWRAIFFINLPVGLVAGYIVARFVPKLKHSGRGKFDAIATVILIVTLYVDATIVKFRQHRQEKVG